MRKCFTIILMLSFYIVQAQDDITTLVFIRHAEKAAVGSDPYLSDKGAGQARCIADMLSFEDVAAIYTTPYNRTRQTAEPIAGNHQLEVLEYDPSNTRFIDELKKKHNGQTVVIIGHSNTVPMLLNSLVGSATYQQMGENEYDKIFIAVTTAYKPVRILTLKIPCDL